MRNTMNFYHTSVASPAERTIYCAMLCKLLLMDIGDLLSLSLYVWRGVSEPDRA